MADAEASRKCRQCAAGLEHCHGTVIHHVSLRSDCTEPDCVTPEVLHAFTIDCEAIDCTCSVSLSTHRVG